MQIKHRNRDISLEEWKALIVKSSNLITMSEWMKVDGARETYAEGVLYVGDIPYGRLMLQNGLLEIDISKTYLSVVYEPLLNIAQELESEFYYDSRTLFDRNKHLPTVTINVNRQKAWFDNLQLPSIWLGVKSGAAMDVLEWLNLTQVGHCSLSEVGQRQDHVYVIPVQDELTLIMGDNLVSHFGSVTGTLQDYAEHLIKTFKKASRHFGEIQLYANTDLKMVGRFQNGQVKLFDISFEGGNFRKGKRGKRLEGLSPAEVASQWSLNPSDLVFFEELMGKGIAVYSR